IDSVGVRPLEAVDLKRLVASDQFFWLDISAADGATWAGLLTNLNLQDPDVSWVQRFGQAGRMVISKDGVRAVTWLGDAAASLIEVHVLCTRRWLLTVSKGAPAALDEARQRFAERAPKLEKSSYQAAATLLQLLLGTLGNAVSDLDSRIESLRDQLEREPGALDLPTLKKRLQRLHAVWAAFDRYASAVRLAIVGVEAVPGMDARGAAELNDYAERVEDIEHRIRDRLRWGSDILQDYAT